MTGPNVILVVKPTRNAPVFWPKSTWGQVIPGGGFLILDPAVGFLTKQEYLFTAEQIPRAKKDWRDEWRDTKRFPKRAWAFKTLRLLSPGFQARKPKQRLARMRRRNKREP